MTLPPGDLRRRNATSGRQIGGIDSANESR